MRRDMIEKKKRCVELYKKDTDLTAKMLATRIGVSTSTVLAWIKEAGLPAPLINEFDARK